MIQKTDLDGWGQDFSNSVAVFFGFRRFFEVWVAFCHQVAKYFVIQGRFFGFGQVFSGPEKIFKISSIFSVSNAIFGESFQSPA